MLLYGDNVGNFSGGAGGIDSSGNVLTVGVTNSAGTVGSIIATSGTSAPVVGDVFPAISVLSFPAEALSISNTSSGLQMDGNIDTGGIAGTSSLTLGGTGVIALAGAEFVVGQSHFDIRHVDTAQQLGFRQFRRLLAPPPIPLTSRGAPCNPATRPVSSSPIRSRTISAQA